MKYSEVSVGTEIPARTFQISRIDLIRYAGASGDFNPIHWNERIATSVGLPNVIAHGMFTMAQVGRFLTDWAGDPSAIREFGVRFSAPVAVPDDDEGAQVMVSGVVTGLLADNRVAVELTATADGATVLKSATAVLQLA